MASNDPRQLVAALAKAEALRDTSQHKSGNRHYHRFVVRGDAELHPMDSDRLDRAPITAMLRDIGRGGVGFVVQQPLPPNSTWRMSFLNHGHVIGQQAIIIRHCRPFLDRVYLVGAQFCIETGLLCLLGVEPGAIAAGDQAGREHDGPVAFLAPGEVA